jgi:hypothetical protein
VTRAFDTWLFEAWRLPDAQRAGYRVVLCSYLLFTGVATRLLLADVPPEVMRAPLGPFMLLPGYPPTWFVLALQAVACGALCLLLAGRVPRASGLVATGAAILLSGITYSAGGKIDHNILYVLAPLVCGFACCGPALTERDRDARAWPIAVFAAVVGFSLFTSAVYKATGGWLALEDSSVQGLQLRNLHVYGRDALLSPLAARIDLPWLWEAADWGTVLLEGCFLVLPFAPRLMRWALVAMSLMHLGIVLLMNISFAGNIVVYALFMRWPASARAWGARVAAAAEAAAPRRVAGLAVLVTALVVGLDGPADLLADAVGSGLVGALLCGLGAGFVLWCGLSASGDA